MTTLMLQELSDAQLGDLDTRAASENDPDSKDTPWNPERKPSQPAIQPWWQRHGLAEDGDRPEPVPLWGRGSGSN
jgi:hypothetical protein